MDQHPVIAAAQWLGWPVANVTPFERYARWLREEAVPAGGLGPQETERILDRHILDSLYFAAAWDGEAPPTTVLDLGSGVGLPAVPLALLWSGSEVIAVERGGKRVDLLNRVRRILDLTNLSVTQTSIAEASSAPMVTMRAVLPPDSWDELVPHIDKGGIGVVALPSDFPEAADRVVVPDTVAGSRHVYQVIRP